MPNEGNLGNLWTRSTPPSGAHQGDLWVDGSSHVNVHNGTGFVPFGLPVYNVLAYGATGNGVADDWQAITNALAAAASAGGGIVYVPTGTYLTSKRLKINASNVWLVGDGRSSVILFVPGGAWATEDRAISLVNESQYVGPFSVSGTISLGATSFTAASSSEAANFAAGDTIEIYETDAGAAGNIVVYEINEVSSVVGTTINLRNPVRVTFPGTHSTPQYAKYVTPVSYVGVRDLRVVTTDAAHSLPGVSVSSCVNVRVEGVVSAPANGNPFYSYKSRNVVFSRCDAAVNNGIANEHSSTLDLALVANDYRSEGALPTTSAVVLDWGTAHFSVTGCRMAAAGNIGVQLQGASDGAIVGNVVSYVRDAGIGHGDGITAIGCTGVTVAGNRLEGGTAGGTGVSFQSSTTWTANVTSANNIAGPNAVSGFTTPYSVLVATDYLIDGNAITAHVANSGSFSVPNNALTAVTFDTNRYVYMASMHSTVSNTSRIVVPFAGKWAFDASVLWAGNGTGAREISLRLNGTTLIGDQQMSAPNAGQFTQAAHAEANLSAGDYVEVVAFQASGGPLNILSAAQYTPEFSTRYLGR